MITEIEQYRTIIRNLAFDFNSFCHGYKQYKYVKRESEYISNEKKFRRKILFKSLLRKKPFPLSFLRFQESP